MAKGGNILQKHEPTDGFDAFLGLLTLMIAIVLSILPAYALGAFGGVALETITGLHYDYSFWIAAIIGLVVSTIFFLNLFYSSPEPKRQDNTGSGFLLGFLVGRFFK